jgi:hypothetical protein
MHNTFTERAGNLIGQGKYLSGCSFTMDTSSNPEMDDFLKNNEFSAQGR